MKIFYSMDEASQWQASQGCVVTIGNFDGVHMGHQQVLAELKGHALMQRGLSVVVTFEPHPRAVLFPDEAHRRLVDSQEKLRLLAQAQVDAVLVLPFNRTFAALSAEQFMREMHQALHFSHIHVGYDFAFGQGREGHVSTLRPLGDQLDFTVSEAAAFEMLGAVVSSSRIRSAIEAADFELGKRLLGRDYSMTGTVIHGAKRGRTIGFPTANIDVENLTHPPVGIYAIEANFLIENGDIERQFHGAAYLGYRPTFNGRTLMLESHLFDCELDLYDQRLHVSFVQRIREDRAFTGADDLACQIAKDCQRAREILAKA
ncbi:MAG: bifunctional riboflavin kinase/FAD synthetase [Zetaproteobacteria bacterium]|nr:bifunctional riboflavin kinase/FAD synthetase [Zetaproteobacteria bacterium]